MATIRRATQMADQEALREVLASLEDNVDSVIHYASAVKPEIRDIFGE
jgi:hypothetical protein